MTHLPQELHPVRMDELLALAAGELTESDARAARAHLRGCARCHELYLRAEAIHGVASQLREPGVDEVTRERLWRAVAPAAQAAARRSQRRSAWQVVRRSPVLRLAVAASVLLLLGAAGLFAYLFQQSDTTRVGSLSAPRMAAESVSDPAPEVWREHGPAVADRSPPAPRPDLQQPVRRRPTRTQPGSRDPRRAARPGERVLRCGAFVALGSATARIARDDSRVAVVRLSVGRVGLRVPRLPSGGRVEVVTPDARVLVKGTRFSVQRSSAGSTTVGVTQGVVWVSPTGRNRRKVVLRAGDRQTVLGEAAYLKQLQSKLAAALLAGRLSEAARLGRRYLEVHSRPARASGIKLQLAGILVRLGQTAPAIRIYRDVARSAGSGVARQNAMAFLARLLLRANRQASAVATWQTLLRRYPGGLYERDALMHLVRAFCHKTSRLARDYRQRLSKRFPAHKRAQALVQRCRPRGSK